MWQTPAHTSPYPQLSQQGTRIQCASKVQHVLGVLTAYEGHQELSTTASSDIFDLSDHKNRGQKSWGNNGQMGPVLGQASACTGGGGGGMAEIEKN